ncbi:MAG: hypothetical protein D6740_06010 [Alphaproteobacteria bacterium]|nr:MAG: hypothetical protein D6740_06010 [Alphaproteobacteria bacterium]
MKTFLVVLLMFLGALPAEAGQVRVRLLVSDPRPLVGQPVRLTLEIEHPLRGIGPLRPRWPNAAGTVLVEEPPGQTVRLGDDRAIELLHRVVRPLSPGPLRLTGGGVVVGTRIIAAAERTLTVAALPPKGRPANFTGLVGQIRADLVPVGDSRFALHLSGDADLNQIPAPVTCQDGTEPVSLQDDIQGHWPNWRRTLTLLTAPGCRPRLQLSWYDPGKHGYISLPERPWGPSVAVAGLALAAFLVAVFFGFEAWRVARCRRILTRLLAGLSHQHRLRRLARAGVPDPLLQCIDRHWRRLEHRHDRQGASAWTQPGQTLPWTICRQLASTIDKFRRHHS